MAFGQKTTETDDVNQPSVGLLGHDFAAVTERQCINHICRSIAAGQGGWLVTANLDHLRRIYHQTAYQRLARQASMIVADGMPLVWASRLQGTPLPERVAGSSMLEPLAAALAEENRSIFMLGGAPGTAEAAGQILQARYPRLRIAAAHCPPPGFEQNDDEWRQIENRLTAAQPDVVFVALGSPKQEQLIERCRPLLPGAWWLGVGVSFSFLCGYVARAPRWMQILGLEWVHRLAQEPRRLAKRYLVHDLPFAGRLFASAAIHRFRGTGRPEHAGRKTPPDPREPAASPEAETSPSHT